MMHPSKCIVAFSHSRIGEIKLPYRLSLLISPTAKMGQIQTDVGKLLLTASIRHWPSLETLSHFTRPLVFCQYPHAYPTAVLVLTRTIIRVAGYLAPSRSCDAIIMWCSNGINSTMLLPSFHSATISARICVCAGTVYYYTACNFVGITNLPTPAAWILYHVTTEIW